MEQEITLTFVNRTERMGKPKEYNGKILPARPYISISIKAQEHGDKYLSGFGGDWNRDWKVGDKVTVMVTEGKIDPKTGQPYLNFARVDKKAELEGRLNVMEKYIEGTIVPALRNLDKRLKELEPKKVAMIGNSDMPYPTPESQDLDPDNMANFDRSDDDLASLEATLG